jgi:hypothetical protein
MRTGDSGFDSAAANVRKSGVVLIKLSTVDNQHCRGLGRRRYFIGSKLSVKFLIGSSDSDPTFAV